MSASIREVPKPEYRLPWTDGTPYADIRAADPTDSSVQARFRGDPQGMFGDQSAWDGASFITLRLAGAIDGILPYSYFPGRRDRQLRIFARTEGILSGGLYSLISRYRSLDYDVLGDSDYKRKYARRLLEGAENGRGLADLIEGFVYDLETQDNGGFVELIGAGDPTTAMVGPVQSIAHLDAGQCMRTFDPEYPVVYIDPLNGKHHKMHRTRVYHTAKMRQPAELARGMGFSAVSRALRDVQYIRNVKMFKDEKVSGRFTRAIGYGSGFTAKQLREVIQTSGEESKAKGFAVYKDIPFIVPPGGGISDVKLGLLDLASLGDGFNYTDELTTYVYILALCFGTDARDFWPAVQSGATKADASVQNMKARGKAFGDTVQMLEYMFTNFVFPSGVSLKYDFKDDEEDLMSAQIGQIRGATLVNIKNAGGISVRELRAQAVAQGVLLESALFPEDESDLIDASKAPTPPVSTPGNPPMAQDKSPDNGPSGDGGGSRNPDKAEPKQPIPFNDNKKKPLRTGSRDFSPVRLTKDTENYQLELESLIEEYIQQYLDGRVTRSNMDSAMDGLNDRYLQLMGGYLDEAFGIGRSWSDPTDIGVEELEAIKSRSATYFAGLTQDLRDVSLSLLGQGLQDADIRSALNGFVSRIDGYAGSLWESAWTGLGDLLRDVTKKKGTSLKVRRVLDDSPKIQHCLTCPDKAKEYSSFDEMRSLAGIPGDGRDDCLGYCRCHIEVEIEPGSGVFTSDISASTLDGWGI